MKEIQTQIQGEREGKQVFGSLNFGREYENGDLIITPTGRIDGSYTALNELYRKWQRCST